MNRPERRSTKGVGETTEMERGRRRAGAGCTYEPCHGCGEEVYRKRGTLCPACRGTLETARRVADTVKSTSDAVAVTFPEPGRSFDLPHYYSHPGDSMSSKTSHELQEALHAILLAVATPVPDEVSSKELPGLVTEERTSYYPKRGTETHSYVPALLTHPPGSYADSSQRYLVPAALVDPVRRLHAAILKGLGEVAEKNRLAGHNLLLGLAKGEVSVTDYNEASVALSERKR
jgi:hypothetical protein